MTAHSHVGASKMHQWANCPGSVRLSQLVPPPPPTFAAAEGTVAHGIGEALLNGKRAPKVGTIVQQECFDVEVTRDMLDAVQVYVDVITERTLPGTVLHVELPLHLKQLHEDLFGTADCVLWHPNLRLLEVIDYKHGAGVAVDAIGNLQMRYYALGALLELRYPAEHVRVTIVQPRCPHPDGPVRDDEFPAIDLVDFAADLVEAVKRTEDPDAPVVVGEWCRFCPASAICPAHRKFTQEVARVTFGNEKSTPPAPATLTPVQIAEVLDKAPIVEAWIKHVRQFAYQQAEDGAPPPGYKLVDKIARRKVRDDVDAAALAGVAGCPVDDLYTKQLLGIGELESLMPGKNAKERAAALAPFTTRESTGHTLVHESDKRLAVVRDPQAAAKQAFNLEKIA